METRTHDTLNRRLGEKAFASGRIIRRLEERDLFWFEKIHRHGPLSSSFLRAYSRILGMSDASATDRLTTLFNENRTPHFGAYLERPWQQKETIDARYNDRVYDITEAAERALKQEGRWREHTPDPTGPWAHKFMVAAATASIELECLTREGFRYIFGDEILTRAGATLNIPMPYTDPNTKERRTRDLIPDAAFGIEYSCGGRVVFLLEADRNTEPTRSYRFDRKSYERTLEQYRQLIESGLYKKHFKLVQTAVIVLHLLTNATHLENVMALLMPNGCNYQAFQAAPQFGRFFKPPKPLAFLFTEPWQRVGRDPFYLFQPS